MNGKTKKIICICTIIGVIIIPLMYSFFYLGAFWDPYSKLDSLPVAIINLDKGAKVNGKTRNLGTELCDTLKKDGTLKFIFTNVSKAKQGTEGLDYYAMLTIPKDFSACIASASTNEKQIAHLEYSSNEKRNYLASQILSRAVLQIEDSLKAKINSEIVAELCEKLQSTPDKLTELTSGLAQLSDGSSKLKDGVSDLSKGAAAIADGMGTLNNKTGEFVTGVSSAKYGADSLLAGANQLQEGIDKLTMGSKQLDDSTANIEELEKSAKLLADNTKQYNEAIQSYTKGVSSLLQTVDNTGSFLTAYVSSHPSLMQDADFRGFIETFSNPDNINNIKALKDATAQLKTSSAQISAGMDLLSNATSDIPALKSGITELKHGLLSAQTGVSQMAKGTATLDTGIAALNDASAKIKAATNDLASGSSQENKGVAALLGGANDLNNGINKAQEGVNNSLKATKEQLGTLNGLSKFTYEPAKINQSAINPVPNYGTAFAPYFLCLSLWVGAIIIFFGIYLDADNKFIILSRNATNKVLRCFIYLLIGLAQALVLAVVLQFGLGLHINHLPLYYFAICLSSMVYIAIVQFLIVFLKDLGKFFSIAFLILQLTSCGGTFPMETVPKFFNIFYPFMPMTYSVGLLKEAISGTTTSLALSNSLVLFGFLITFTTLTLVCGIRRNKKKPLVV